jgi:hypothetical protein
VRVAVYIFGKSKLPKGLFSHCIEFLAVFHSQCLSGGTRLEDEEKEKKNKKKKEKYKVQLW